MSNTPAKMDETSAAVALPDDLGDLIPTMDDLGVSSGMLASLTPTFKVPSATVAAFSVPELLRDEIGADSVSEVVGVPITTVAQRVRWEPGSELGEAAPTCRSNDGKTGSGEFTGGAVRVCAECPAQQFGDDGTPPECSERSAVLVTLQGSQDTAVLSVPTTSIGPVKRWAAGMVYKAAKGQPSYMTVLTRFSLKVEPLKNSGKKVAQFVVENLGVADDELLGVARTSGASVARAFRDSGEHVADAPAADVVADSRPQEV